MSVSTNAAGDEVYFTTYLRPIDSDHGPWTKAYVWTEDGIELVADNDIESGAWRVDGVDARFGGVLGIRRSDPCVIGTACLSILQEFSELRTATGARELEGHIALSPNGAYALLVRTTGFGFLPGDELLSRTLQRIRIDDPAAQPESVGRSRPAISGRWIANNGTVLTGGWKLLDVEGHASSLGPAGLAQAAFLAPDASFVAYQLRDEDHEIQDPGQGELRLAFVDGTDVPLGVTGRLLDLSADGSTLLYTRQVEGTPQAFLLAVPGGVERQATDEPDGVEAAALNADGSIVFAVSAGRLLRFAAGLPVETLVGPLPDIERPIHSLSGRPHRDGLVAPGSTYRQSGMRLAEATAVAAQPAGSRLDGVSISVDDTPTAVLWTSPFEIGFQVAWETPLVDASDLIVRHDRSGWEAVLGFGGVRQRLAQPATERVDNVNLAIHQNFDRLVTVQDPAHRGELIHIYATGLGPVSPPIPTGEAAPLDRLTSLAESCDWRMSIGGPGDAPADIVFAGLAPGFTGFYQVVWRIPEDAAGGPTQLFCGDQGSVGTYAVEE